MSRQQSPEEPKEDGELSDTEWDPTLGLDEWERESQGNLSSCSIEYILQGFEAKQYLKPPNATDDPRYSGWSYLFGDLSSSSDECLADTIEAAHPSNKLTKATHRNETEKRHSNTHHTVTESHEQDVTAELPESNATQREALAKTEAQVRRRSGDSEAQSQVPTPGGSSTLRHAPYAQPAANNHHCIVTKTPSRVPRQLHPGTSSAFSVPSGSQSYGKGSVNTPQSSSKKRSAPRGPSTRDAATSLLQKLSSASRAKRARPGGTTHLQCTLSFEELQKQVKDASKFWDKSAKTATCPTCSLTFKAYVPSNVLRHLATHLADKSLYPFKCPLSNCRYTALRREGVRLHVPSHGLSWTAELDKRCVDVENRARFMALFD